MKIIDTDLLPVPETRTGRRSVNKLSLFGSVWSSSAKEKRPLGFPAHDAEHYQRAADAYIHITTSALLNAQFHAPDLPKFHTNSEYDAAQVEVNLGRALVSPEVLSDADLKRYIMVMAPYALGSSLNSRVEPQSPLIAPYLLGGMTNLAYEELCERVMDVMGFPEQLVDPTFNNALAVVGFGPHAGYQHQDKVSVAAFNKCEDEDDAAYASRLKKLSGVSEVYAKKGYLAARQQWLMDKVPEGPFASRLMRVGAYEENLIRRVARMKGKVCAKVAAQFQLPMTSESEMSQLTHKRMRCDDYSRRVRITDMMYENAVVRVFERPWLELDLAGRTPDDLHDDVEKTIARLIIKGLAAGGERTLKNTVKLSPRVLVATALLTGVPIGSWVKFALRDFLRRGETFVSQQTIESILTLLYENEDLFVYLTCSDELESAQFRLGVWEKNDYVTQVARFAHKLRVGATALWSRDGNYHLTFESDGVDQHNVWNPPRDLKLLACPSEQPFVKGEYRD